MEVQSTVHLPAVGFSPSPFLTPCVKEHMNEIKGDKLYEIPEIKIAVFLANLRKVLGCRQRGIFCFENCVPRKTVILYT